MTFHPDGKYLATASLDGTVKLLEIDNPRNLKLLFRGTAAVNCVTFNNDGSYLAIATSNNICLMQRDIITPSSSYNYYLVLCTSYMPLRTDGLIIEDVLGLSEINKRLLTQNEKDKANNVSKPSELTTLEFFPEESKNAEIAKLIDQLKSKDKPITSADIKNDVISDNKKNIASQGISTGSTNYYSSASSSSPAIYKPSASTQTKKDKKQKTASVDKNDKMGDDNKIESNEKEKCLIM